MGIGTTILAVLYILVCVFLIFIILLQRGDSGGLGGLGGGLGGGDSFLGASADRTMKKITLYTSILFVFFSIFLGIVQSQQGSEVGSGVDEQQEESDTTVLPGPDDEQ